MGIDDFFSFISSNTIFNENNKSVIKDYNEQSDIEEIYFDFNSIVYQIAELIEKDINGLRWDCIKGNLTEESKEIIKKYKIDIDTENIQDIKDIKDINNTKKLLETIRTLNLDKYGINSILTYLCDICKKFTLSDKLKHIYISVDGMPNMGKIFEQQKRKYENTINLKISKLIYGDYEHTLSKERKEYESHKYIFHKDKLIPQLTPDNIMEIITSSEFFSKLKESFPNIESIEVNPRECPGEGEKKIMEKIIQEKRSKKYLIYSSDSDLIMISLILSTFIKDSEFYVLRWNKLYNTYELIDINMIIDNIYNKITNKKINKTNVIRDISCIMTLFGNDFIPKIYTVSIRLHHKLLLNTYFTILENYNNDNDNKHLMLFNNDTKLYEFNWEFLITYFNQLAQSEHYLYSDMYIKNHYNINHLLPYMIKSTLSETLHIYVKAINKFIFADISRYKHSSLSTQELILKKNSNNLVKFFETSENVILFIKFFIASHYLSYDKNSTDIKGMLKYIYNNFNMNKTYYLLKLKSLKHDFSCDYIINKIKTKFPRNNIDITEYDIELYKYHRKLENYNIITPYSDIKNIGRFVINYNNTDNKLSYCVIQTPVQQNSNNYIEYCLKIDRKYSMESLNITQDYIIGFNWLMNEQFNRNCPEENIKYVSSWAYSHLYPPTLYMIGEYFIELKKIIDKKLARNIPYYHNTKYDIVGEYMKIQSANIFSLERGIIYIERDKFITDTEREILINPVNQKDRHSLSDNYIKLRNDKNIFPNIDDIVSEMYLSIKNKIKYIQKDILPRLTLTHYIELLNKYNPLRAILH